MVIHIHLHDPPPHYTNLDTVRGEVKLFLNKPETLRTIVVKLEGEALTVLKVPAAGSEHGWLYRGRPLVVRPDPGDPTRQTACPLSAGTVQQEKHKIVYQVVQINPDTSASGASTASTGTVVPKGHHVFPFQFRLPFHNVCSDPVALAQSVDVEHGTNSDAALDAAVEQQHQQPSKPIRVMDASKQLLYQHVSQILPPTLAGFAGQAEIRYFVKVTVQRPGLFRENWRSQVGFAFIPLEPPRPPPSSREVFVNRAFTFSPSFLPSMSASASAFMSASASASASVPSLSSAISSSLFDRDAIRPGLPPSIRIEAFLPFPAILTPDVPIPLRIVATKLAPSSERVILSALAIHLIGTTRLRALDLERTQPATIAIVSLSDLAIPLHSPDSPVGAELAVPPAPLWGTTPLPGSILPGFQVCNMVRAYGLELRVSLTWDRRASPEEAAVDVVAPVPAKTGKAVRRAKRRDEEHRRLASAFAGPQTITLPLFFQDVDVFSGLVPRQVENERQWEALRRRQTQEQRQWQQSPHDDPRRPPPLHQDHTATPIFELDVQTPPCLPPCTAAASTDARNAADATTLWHGASAAPAPPAPPTRPAQPVPSALAVPVELDEEQHPPSTSTDHRAASGRGMSTSIRRPPVRVSYTQHQQLHSASEKPPLESCDSLRLAGGDGGGGGPSQRQYHLHPQQTDAFALAALADTPSHDNRPMQVPNGHVAPTSMPTIAASAPVPHGHHVAPHAPHTNGLRSHSYIRPYSTYDDPPPTYDEAVAEINAKPNAVLFASTNTSDDSPSDAGDTATTDVIQPSEAATNNAQHPSTGEAPQ